MVLMVVWVTTQREVILYYCMDHGIGWMGMKLDGLAWNEDVMMVGMKGVDGIMVLMVVWLLVVDR